MEYQPQPVCVYYFGGDLLEGEHFSNLFFHKDYPDLVFERFCLDIVMPHVKMLENKGYEVHWGYVNSSKQTSEEAIETLKHLTEWEEK